MRGVLSISSEALHAVISSFGLQPKNVRTIDVTGGYSRNRRSIVGDGKRWIFVKEVDVSLLPNDGIVELEWLRKDLACIEFLRDIVPGIVPDWSKLIYDDHVLCMAAYRKEDGWIWGVPSEGNVRPTYVQTILDGIGQLEGVSFNRRQANSLSLQPLLRDKLALDSGIDALSGNSGFRDALKSNYKQLLLDESNVEIARALGDMIKLLDDNRIIGRLHESAKRLVEQPNNCIGHGDVRSDNIAYNPLTNEFKLVDWNWASYVPSGFGATEFLIDMKRCGVDVTQWLGYLNREMLAAMVGFYAKRCLLPRLAPGNSLRTMQAKSAAVAASLYSDSMKARP